MKELISTIFGTYVPITYEQLASDGTSYDTIIAAGFAGVDWEYIAGVFLFGLTLYCVMRMIGSVISNG